MFKNDISLGIFNTSLFSLSLYLLLHYLPSFDFWQWILLLFFSATVLLFAFLKTRISTGEIFSLEGVFLIIYSLTYGFSGIWVAAISMGFFVLLTRPRLRESMYIIGSSVLAIWGALAAYNLTGGQFGNLDLMENLLSLVSFIALYLIMLFGFTAIHRSLQFERHLEVVTLIKDNSLIMGLVVVLSILGTIVYQSSGMPGLVVNLILLAVVWKGLRVFSYSEQKYVKTVETFLNVTENKIPHLRGHSERVTKFCQLILKECRVTKDERSTIEHAALLHDIGKLGMPEKLLKIRSYLTNEEVQKLQAHVETGRNLVQQIHSLEKVSELIYAHHEKYDGTGYPRQLKGEEIPFGARVIAVANKFDNLIFRDGLRFEQACTEVKNLSSSFLDPNLVNIFLKALMNYNKVIAMNDNYYTDRLESNAKDIVEQLRYYLDKSWVLGSLKMSCVALYENETLKNIGVETIPDTIQGYLKEYLQKKITACRKEFIIEPESSRIFEAYFIPISDTTCLINVFDMTEVLKIERERDERELKIYRDVILAVTQGKLLLTIGDEINNHINSEFLHSEMRILEPQDVARARTMVRGVLESVPLSSQRKGQMVLCVSEAATNVIKHVGEGRIAIYLLENALRIVIKDNGPGIDISQLPQVTLRKGYSTKLSLGYGFTIMLDYLDRLIMSTKGGTILVLEMAYNMANTENAEEQLEREKVVPKNAC